MSKLAEPQVSRGCSQAGQLRKQSSEHCAAYSERKPQGGKVLELPIHKVYKGLQKLVIAAVCVVHASEAAGAELAVDALFGEDQLLQAGDLLLNVSALRQQPT